MKKKRVFRFFTIVDFEKEEEWLGRMHQNGWKFTGYRYGLSHFEECPPEDAIYRMDFKEKKLDDQYLQPFADAGWEYVSTCQNFAYFRKRTVDFLPEKDRQLASDVASRLDMMDRVVKRRMATVLVGFAICLYLIIDSLKHDISVFQLLTLLLCAGYIYLLLRVGRGYYKLQKQYKQ